MDFFDLRTAIRDLDHTKRQRRFIDVRQHVAEKAFMGIGPGPEPDLRHIVAIRHRLGQGVALAQQVGLHFVLHQFQRGMVDGNVMEQQDRHPTPIGPVFGARQSHQRGLAQIQAVMPGVETLTQPGFDITVGRGQIDFLHRQRRLTQYYLHRFVEPLPDHRRAQDIVPFDHRLQGLGEIIETFTAIRAEQRPQHIGVALSGGQVMIEDAFLQRC